MLDSATEARATAATAGAALRLVNELAAESLIAAVCRGESSARVAVAPVDIAAGGQVGRLYDEKLIDLLEKADERTLSRACRIFVALGFNVSTAPVAPGDGPAAHAVEPDGVMRITHLDLGYAAAPDALRAASGTLLTSVRLPAAHLWRARAEAARRIDADERRALAKIAEQAERGNESCRLGARAFGAGAGDVGHLRRLAERLRNRGFRVELIEATGTLHVTW